MEATLENISTLIIGHHGKMPELFQQYFPNATGVDLKSFEEKNTSGNLYLERYVRRLVSSKLKSISRKARKASDGCSICVVSVPNTVYQKAGASPGEGKLANLLGISSRGYNSTIFVHQTSTHLLPSKILEQTSGVAVGLHLLHGASVKNFAQQTAILTFTKNKRKHHNFKLACEILNNILREQMGYRQVFHMSPERHDSIMSNIQFLTHSMYLIVSDILISNNYSITRENYLSVPSAMLVLLGRMTKQPLHVYRGIASLHSNKFNGIVIKQLEKLTQMNSFPEKSLANVISKFSDIRDHMIAATEMSTKEQRRITTPVSRCRDGIIKKIKHPDEPNINIDQKDYISAYINAVNGNYDNYFRRISCAVKQKLMVLEDFEPDYEARVMRKYEHLV